MTPIVGLGQHGQNTAASQVQKWFNQASQTTKRKRKNDYLAWATPYLVSALFLENRLTALRETGNIDYEKQPPQSDLHALHLNDEARKALAVEMVRAFSKAVWSDSSRGTKLCLRVADTRTIPSAEDRLSVREMSKYRTIESEGDGMKSYAATCISILLGRRPVSVIDEPEMCLHPPQAYNLGQFIGEHGTSTHTATFVATHSSAVLRGIIQTADTLRIVRLAKMDNAFFARQVDSDVLSEAIRKPTVRAETVLDGIFSQAVIVIEGDGDRIVYQAAWESVGGELNFDIHFASVGGTGGIADTCDLYRILGIPVGVIADLDVILDKDKLTRILRSLGVSKDRTANLMEKTAEVAAAILELPPNISVQVVIEKLQTLGAQDYDWSKADDNSLRVELNQLSNSLNRMRKLKRGGVKVVPNEIVALLNTLIEKFEALGIFLVPYGDLEEWLADCGLKSSKTQNKWAWANEAATYIRGSEPRDDDVWGFMRRLGSFLRDNVP